MFRIFRQPRHFIWTGTVWGVLLLSQGAWAQIGATPEAPPITVEELNAIVSGPTLVNYSGQDVPIEEVANALLATVNFPALPPKWSERMKIPKTLSVKWKNTPFWKAARQFEEITGLIWFDSSEYGLIPGRQSEDDPNGSNGVLLTDTSLVQVAGVGIEHSASSSLWLGEKPYRSSGSSDSTQIILRFYLDPKLIIESGSVSLVNLFVSNDPKPLRAVPEYPSPFQGKFPRLTSTLQLGLLGGQKSGSVLHKVSGVLRSAVVMESKTWKISNLLHASNVKENVNSIEYAVEGAEFEGSQFKLRTSAVKAVPPTPKPVQGILFSSPDPAKITARLRVKDATGQELDRVQNQMTDVAAPEGQQKVQNEITFRAIDDQGQLRPGPYSLEWDLPAVTRTLDTPFELHDIEIP